MRAAYPPVVKVVGDTRASMTHRGRGVWSLRDPNANSLAIAKRRFKARPHIDHSLSQVGLSVRSRIATLPHRWVDDIFNGQNTLMRPTCRSQAGSRTRRSDTPKRFFWRVASGSIEAIARSLAALVTLGHTLEKDALWKLDISGM